MSSVLDWLLARPTVLFRVIGLVEAVLGFILLVRRTDDTPAVGWLGALGAALGVFAFCLPFLDLGLDPATAAKAVVYVALVAVLPLLPGIPVRAIVVALVDRLARLVDHLRPRWKRKYSDWRDRLEAVEALTRPRSLERVARNDAVEAVRLAAIQRLDRQDVLADIARQSPRGDEERRAAIVRIVDQSLLVDLALHAPSATARLAAVQRITAPGLCLQVATNADDAAARALAVQGVTSQRALADLAKSDKDREVRRAAAARIVEQDLLGEVAKSCSEEDLFAELIERLTDQAVLVDIAKNRIAWRSWQAALDRITSQEGLFDVAQNAVYPDSQIKAVERLADQAALEKIARTAQSSHVRLAAVRRLTDEGTLTAFATEDVEVGVRLLALQRLTTQNVVAAIAIRDPDSRVRQAAVARLTDDDLLTGIAIDDKDPETRRLAAERVADQDKLAILVGKLLDENERKMASERLDPNQHGRLLRILRADDGAATAESDPDSTADIARLALSAEARRAAVPRVAAQEVLVQIAGNRHEHLDIRRCAVDLVGDSKTRDAVLVKTELQVMAAGRNDAEGARRLIRVARHKPHLLRQEWDRVAKWITHSDQRCHFDGPSRQCAAEHGDGFEHKDAGFRDLGFPKKPRDF
jgi:hypothetical protein